MSGILALGICLLVGLQLLVFATLASRLVGVGRRLGDRRELGKLLSQETRAAVREAGLDPDDFGLPDLRDHEALRERVAADLRRALTAALWGRAAPGAAAPLPGAALAQSGRAPAQGGGSAQMPSLPPPIDAPRSSPLPLVALVGALALLGFFLFQRLAV